MFNEGYYYYSPSQFCKLFSTKDESCGWWFSYIFLDICTTELYYFTPSSGSYYDIRGICWTPGKPCRDVSDCELTTEVWCDITDGLCKPRLRTGYGCDPTVEKVF